MTHTPARPLACTKCGHQCGIAEDVESYSDWGPAVIGSDGVVRPQHPDLESGHKHDPHTVRIRAYCQNANCGHQWTLRRRFDSLPEQAAS
ncbi:hypothetical protein [Streptomyces wuyuanensis]|uniref:Uncharacterized protein n=1 Tax=Streptomyces wuyuanensis TaxID=1196353 RepID=A0A1G9ZB27_9ACTN|nr:hypothetical protein [Streptomyces wuyuanensis]SDN18484.1 hypothetical protein SAMN05444921_12158 [Streptomyces wuyuanensis]